MRYRQTALLGLVMALTLAGCGGDDEDDAAQTPSTPTETQAPAATEGMLTELGKAEGQVNLVAWAGYVENGSTDPKTDWVTGFEKSSGCKVKVTIGNSSDEMVTLMKTGKYDGVSASGDASLRLISAKDVAPVNLDLIPNYKDVFDGLKNKPHNTVDGVSYGTPHGRGANLLMYNTAKVKPAPDSWSVVWDAKSDYKGKVTAYDSPIYIADAALYLKSTQPDLGIENVYELDDKQFTAAIDLLKTQRKIVGEYWSDYTKEVDAFAKGNSVVGTTWQVIANLLAADKVGVKAILPKEGSTGWSDTWMISSKAKNPNCMYMWMNHIASPKANAQATEYFGEAPANKKSCALTTDKKHCDTFHATDEAYFEKVAFWTTPVKDCGDDRGEVCKDYSEWVKAWTEIKG